MTATVPTADEFASLEARVAALEGGAQPPQPEPPPSGEGVQAKRIAALIELFGVGTFASVDTSNVWGSWPADYRPQSVADGLNWLTGESGFKFRIREYHYDRQKDLNRTWLTQLNQLVPGTRTVLCIGAGGNANDTPSMKVLADNPACGIAWLEGINEPNMDFGWGLTSVEQTLETQAALWANAAGHHIIGPSIVAGMPNPAGWVCPPDGYFKTDQQMSQIRAAMHEGSAHYYPPHCPDTPNTGYSIHEYVDGLSDAYLHPTSVTEFHPTLYGAGDLSALQSNIGRLAGGLRGPRRPLPKFRASPERDGYYTLLSLLRCGLDDVPGLWWFALFDYGYDMQCGLFPKTGGVEPRAGATAMRNLCAICADTGDRNGFEPGKLDIAVAGLTEAMDFDLYQASDGRFLVPIWYAAADVGGGPKVTVTLTFGSRVDVRMFAPLSGPGVVQETHVSELDIDLEPGVIVLEVVR